MNRRKSRALKVLEGLASQHFLFSTETHPNATNTTTTAILFYYEYIPTCYSLANMLIHEIVAQCCVVLREKIDSSENAQLALSVRLI